MVLLKYTQLGADVLVEEVTNVGMIPPIECVMVDDNTRLCFYRLSEETRTGTLEHCRIYNTVTYPNGESVALRNLIVLNRNVINVPITGELCHLFCKLDT